MEGLTPIITVPEGKIRDYIDGKFRNDTPEEYVRQNIEKRLVNEHNYPKELVKIEFTVNLARDKKRADIVVFPENCENFVQENVYLIVECKKENINSSDKKDGVEQLKAYMAACSNCEWGMWTNGKEKIVYRKVKDEKGKYDYEDFIDIPSFDTPIEDIERPKRHTQKKAIEDNLLFAFKNCHNIIYANDGMQKQPAFFELLKLIFCKIEDEKNILEEIQFYVKNSDRNNTDGQLTVKNRIEKIFTKVKKKFDTIFESNEKINLNPRTLANVVAVLQNYNFLDTNIDVKGKAYEEIVGSNLRGDRGEFFTPRNVMKMTVEMIDPTINDKVLDCSCGTGGFLVNAMNHVIVQIEKQSEKQFKKPKNKWLDKEKDLVRNKIKEIASKNFFGFDINPDLVKATKMNMVMNNDGSGNIFRINSLLHPHEWDTEFRESFAKALDVKPELINSSKSIGFFDVIVTNPPFGSKIQITGSSILNQFELAKGKNSVPPEQLFIERCVQLLKPGGRLGIVLPDAILGAPGLDYIRSWIFKSTFLIASIDLHADTFQPRNGTQTSVLILKKKTPKELTEPFFNYNVFMAIIEKIGHDKRGTPLYKRDKDGEILYFKKSKVNDNGIIEEWEEPELDDQTILVPEVFAQWLKKEGIKW